MVKYVLRNVYFEHKLTEKQNKIIYKKNQDILRTTMCILGISWVQSFAYTFKVKMLCKNSQFRKNHIIIYYNLHKRE